jgi:hypothetical protein
MDQEIVKVDKAYRNRLFVAYLVLIIAGVLIYQFALPYILQAFQNLPVRTAFIVAEVVFDVFFLCFIAPAVYLISIGRKIVRHSAVPYPGMKVIRDTIVITGKKAIFRGKLLAGLGYVSIAFAILGCIWLRLVIIWINHDPIMRMFSPL